MSSSAIFILDVKGKVSEMRKLLEMKLMVRYWKTEDIY
jgi:hypothetical protein